MERSDKLVLEILKEFDIVPGALFYREPNERIWDTVKSCIWISLFYYLLMTIAMLLGFISTRTGSVIQLVNDRHEWANAFLFYWEQEPRYLVVLLLLAMLVGFMIYGGTTCIQHLCLRIILTRTHKIPWNLAQFLNYCTERRLLQRIGGRYRFLHRELLDYFATLQT